MSELVCRTGDDVPKPELRISGQVVYVMDTQSHEMWDGRGWVDVEPDGAGGWRPVARPDSQ